MSMKHEIQYFWSRKILLLCDILEVSGDSCVQLVALGHTPTDHVVLRSSHLILTKLSFV